MWQQYTAGKQTLAQLALAHGVSARTIQRRLDKVTPKRSELKLGAGVVLMDTTYFGRSWGVMVFKDSATGRILYKAFVRNETNQLYCDGIEAIQAGGYKVEAIVCDGRKGLIGLFDIPMQMCQFHQVAIVTRYLTRRPKSQAARELRSLSLLLSKTDKESFTGGLVDWQVRWKTYLEERTTNPETGRSHYTHKRLRSAYLSLKRNLVWLFTWYDHTSLGIPNTTNALDGQFADLKNKLRCHNGLSERRKRRLIEEFFLA